MIDPCLSGCYPYQKKVTTGYARIELSKHYDTLTAPERLKVALDAMARGDWDEARKLGETCPKSSISHNVTLPLLVNISHCR